MLCISYQCPESLNDVDSFLLQLKLRDHQHTDLQAFEHLMISRLNGCSSTGTLLRIRDNTSVEWLREERDVLLYCPSGHLGCHPRSLWNAGTNDLGIKSMVSLMVEGKWAWMPLALVPGIGLVYLVRP